MKRSRRISIIIWSGLVFWVSATTPYTPLFTNNGTFWRNNRCVIGLSQREHSHPRDPDSDLDLTIPIRWYHSNSPQTALHQRSGTAQQALYGALDVCSSISVHGQQRNSRMDAGVFCPSCLRCPLPIGKQNTGETISSSPFEVFSIPSLRDSRSCGASHSPGPAAVIVERLMNSADQASEHTCSAPPITAPPRVCPFQSR